MWSPRDEGSQESIRRCDEQIRPIDTRGRSLLASGDVAAPKPTSGYPLFYDKKEVATTCSIGREYDECHAPGWTPFLVSETGLVTIQILPKLIWAKRCMEKEETCAEGPSCRASF